MATAMIASAGMGIGASPQENNVIPYGIDMQSEITRAINGVSDVPITQEMLNKCTAVLVAEDGTETPVNVNVTVRKLPSQSRSVGESEKYLTTMYMFWKCSATGRGVLMRGSHFKLKLVLAIIMLIPFTVYFADILLAWVRPLTGLFSLPSKWIFDTVSDSGSMMFLKSLKEVPIPWSFESAYGEVFNYRIAAVTHLIPFYMLRIYCFFWIFKSMYSFKFSFNANAKTPESDMAVSESLGIKAI